MFEALKNKYPFLTDYFSSILKAKEERIPHCVMFYGQDLSAQYELAMEISRALRCLNKGEDSCECLNCRWIKDKTHPDVLTITNLDSKPQGDETKNVISIKQTQMVKSLLVNTSDEYRIFIFCGAKVLDEKWIPTGLNQENFKAESANSLLKIVEEAPQKTIFFFLANDISDVISTIVSRAQCFFDRQSLSYSGTKDLFEDYPNFETYKLFDYSSAFITALKNYDEILFDRCENYLLSLLKSNLENEVLKQRIIEDMRSFERAKQMHLNGIKPETIADDLFLALMRK